MTGGAFEKAKDAILRSGKINGGLDTRSLFDIIIASHADNRTDHYEIGKTCAKLEKLIDDETVQTKRIVAHLESETGTTARAMAAHCADTNAHRREPRRESDPLDVTWSPPVEDEQLGDMRRVWRVGRWIVIALGAALIVMLAQGLGQVIFG